MRRTSVLVALAMAGCGNSGEAFVDSVIGSSRVQRSCVGESDTDLAAEASIVRILREEGVSRLEILAINIDTCDEHCGLDDFCFGDCIGCGLAIVDAVYDR